MIFSTFLVVIFSILFGMYLGFSWAKGEDIFFELSRLFTRVKFFIKKIVS